MLPITLAPLGALVLALAACGVAGSLPIAPGTADQPELRCALAVTERGGQVQIEAQVQALTAVSGRYALKIAQTGGSNQTLIDQSGDFSASPGAVVILGSASVSGTAANYDATLTLITASATITCPVTASGL